MLQTYSRTESRLPTSVSLISGLVLGWLSLVLLLFALDKVDPEGYTPRERANRRDAQLAAVDQSQAAIAAEQYYLSVLHEELKAEIKALRVEVHAARLEFGGGN